MPAQTQVRPLPPAVRARLDKLMPLLGSDNDGERNAAIAAITTLLKTNGLDWHDVAGSIGQPTPAAPPPPQANADPYSLRPHTMPATELRSLVHRILRSPLNGRARRFLTGMQSHADVYGHVKFSDKQWKWLMDLAKRAQT